MFNWYKKIQELFQKPKQTCLNCKYKPDDGPYTLWCRFEKTCWDGELWEPLTIKE